MALVEHKQEGKHRSQHIGDGHRSPDTRQAVAAGIDEDGRDEVNHRGEEEHLAREAGDDGDPRLVDALEEVGIGDGETHQREHHHHETHGRYANLNEFLLLGEKAQHGMGQYQG